MSIAVVNDIALSYGDTDILKKVSFSVNAGDKLGIIGVNGAGKSTLFSIILGDIAPTSGTVTIKSGARIGHLAQINDSHRFGCTVYQAAICAFESLLMRESRIEELKKQMESGDENAIESYVQENERFISDGGNEFRSKTKALLDKFGFPSEMLDISADTLSGGQKTKLLLVKLMLEEPDILLLDEPTNHLDTDACEWLENFVSTSKKTFLIISHDRYFLDKVTNKTLEISHGESEIYKGSYSEFREKKKELDKAKLKHYNLQQKEIKRIEDFIDNQRKWNREKNIIAAESRQKQLDKMVKLRPPKEREKGINFSLSNSKAQGKDVLSVRGLSKSYPNTFLFKNLSFELHRGDRLFILGANGCGKSTLLKILTGREKQDEGIFELGYNQTLGYYDQEQQLLTQENTVIDELWSVYGDRSNTEIRSMLARFGFRNDDVFKTVSLLSGGERARLSIAKMISCGVSLLVLDEPTNHLDIDSREMLEKAISEYDGTVLAVSHDRYFVKSLADRILEINSGYDESYRIFSGGYEEFEKRSRITGNETDSSHSEKGRLSFEEAKQRKNRLRSAKTHYEEAEKEISVLENKVEEIKKKTSDSEIASDFEALNKLFDEQNKAEEKMNILFDELLKLEKEINDLQE